MAEERHTGKRASYTSSLQEKGEPLSASPAISLGKAKALRRQTLAPSRMANATTPSNGSKMTKISSSYYDEADQSASLLMDTSIGELAPPSILGKAPDAGKGRKLEKIKTYRMTSKEDRSKASSLPEGLTEQYLDELSEQDLEKLAWEAMEQEKRLKDRRRRSTNTAGGQKEKPHRLATIEESSPNMKNVSVRKRSPRKSVLHFDKSELTHSEGKARFAESDVQEPHGQIGNDIRADDRAPRGTSSTNHQSPSKLPVRKSRKTTRKSFTFPQDATNQNGMSDATTAKSGEKEPSPSGDQEHTHAENAFPGTVWEVGASNPSPQVDLPPPIGQKETRGERRKRLGLSLWPERDVHDKQMAHEQAQESMSNIQSNIPREVSSAVGPSREVEPELAPLEQEATTDHHPKALSISKSIAQARGPEKVRPPQQILSMRSSLEEPDQQVIHYEICEENAREQTPAKKNTMEKGKTTIPSSPSACAHLEILSNGPAGDDGKRSVKTVKTVRKPTLPQSPLFNSLHRRGETSTRRAHSIAANAAMRSPIIRTRLQKAVEECSQRARANAKAAASKKSSLKKANILVENAHSSQCGKAPSGFRISSTGALVPLSRPKTFSFAQAKGRNQAEEQAKNTRSHVGPKANPVPDWLKERRLELAKEESKRLEEELERAHTEELHRGRRIVSKTERKASDASGKGTTTSGGTPFVSFVETRIAERAAWEERRKAKEEAIEKEKVRARLEREQREEKEYQEARKKAVPKANPVPDWIYGVKVSTERMKSSKAP